MALESPVLEALTWTEEPVRPDLSVFLWPQSFDKACVFAELQGTPVFTPKSVFKEVIFNANRHHKRI